MPIRAELRGFYPSDWPQISRHVRFERAGGICEECGRPHGATNRCLPAGRGFDATGHTWRNRRGRPARWPDLVETAQIRQTRVILAAAHLDHDPRNNRRRNLKSLCQRCHMIHDRPHHSRRSGGSPICCAWPSAICSSGRTRVWLQVRRRRSFRDAQTACRAPPTLPRWRGGLPWCRKPDARRKFRPHRHSTCGDFWNERVSNPRHPPRRTCCRGCEPPAHHRWAEGPLPVRSVRARRG